MVIVRVLVVVILIIFKYYKMSFCWLIYHHSPHPCSLLWKALQLYQ